MANNGQFTCFSCCPSYKSFFRDKKKPKNERHFELRYLLVGTKWNLYEIKRVPNTIRLVGTNNNLMFFCFVFLMWPCVLLFWIRQVADESTRQQPTTLQQLQAQQQARMRRSSMRRMVRFRMSAGSTGGPSADVDPINVSSASPSGKQQQQHHARHKRR